MNRRIKVRMVIEFISDASSVIGALDGLHVEVRRDSTYSSMPAEVVGVSATEFEERPAVELHPEIAPMEVHFDEGEMS